MENSKDKTNKKNKNSLKITFSRKNLILAFIPLLVSMLIVVGYKYKNEVVLATVNGKPITRLKLWKRLEQQGGAQTLDSLITQELILQEGKEQNIVVSQQVIDEEIGNIEKTVSLQGSTLEQALETQGMSKEEFQNQIKIQILLEKLLADKITVADFEVNDAITSAVESGQQDTLELREQIKAQLGQEKLSQAIQEYVSNMKQNAEVNILNNDFAL